MKQTNFTGHKAAFLIENGFCERELNQSLKAMRALGFDCRSVSTASGSVKAWNELNQDPNASNWGMEYAIDKNLNDALSSDYSVLVIPGGKRSIEKLRNLPEAKQFVSSFINTGKPVVAYNLAIDYLSFSNLVKGYSLAAKGELCDVVKINGAKCTPAEFMVSKNLVTLARFLDIQKKIEHAVTCIMNGEKYTETVGADNFPTPHKVA